MPISTSCWDSAPNASRRIGANASFSRTFCIFLVTQPDDLGFEAMAIYLSKLESRPMRGCWVIKKTRRGVGGDWGKQIDAKAFGDKSTGEGIPRVLYSAKPRPYLGLHPCGAVHNIDA